MWQAGVSCSQSFKDKQHTKICFWKHYRREIFYIFPSLQFDLSLGRLFFLLFWSERVEGASSLSWSDFYILLPRNGKVQSVVQTIAIELARVRRMTLGLLPANELGTVVAGKMGRSLTYTALIVMMQSWFKISKVSLQVAISHINKKWLINSEPGAFSHFLGNSALSIKHIIRTL